VPGVTGSELLALDRSRVNQIPKAAMGGAVVVWAKEAPEISVTIAVTMMKDLSIERTPSRELQFIVFNPVRE
jgi:hypothetical protein